MRKYKCGEIFRFECSAFIQLAGTSSCNAVYWPQTYAACVQHRRLPASQRPTANAFIFHSSIGINAFVRCYGRRTCSSCCWMRHNRVPTYSWNWTLFAREMANQYTHICTQTTLQQCRPFITDCSRYTNCKGRLFVIASCNMWAEVLPIIAIIGDWQISLFDFTVSDDDFPETPSFFLINQKMFASQNSRFARTKQ